jgi:hypothetical protein
MEASKHGVPFHDDLDVPSRGDVDGVVVTTPTVAHREIIPAAASAGKHAFAEKVIAPTLSEAWEVVAEVEKAGVTFVVSLPGLYAWYTRAIREALAGGEIGEPLIEERPFREDRAGALEAVPLARDRIDDVDLDRRIVAQVLDCARRADVGEDQVVVIPYGGGAFGREVWRRVGADGGRITQALFLDHAPHFLVNRPHAFLLEDLRPRSAGNDSS